MGIWDKIKKKAKNVWKGVKKVVKKVWESPVGKVVIAAAAIYTGGAALAALSGGTGWAGFTAALASPSAAMGGYASAGKAVVGGIKSGFTGAPAAGAGGAGTGAGGYAAASATGNWAPVAAAHGAGAGAAGGAATAAGAAGAAAGGGLLTNVGRGIGAVAKGAVGAGKWLVNNPEKAATIAATVGPMLTPSPQEEAAAIREDEQNRMRRQAQEDTANVGFPWFNSETGKIELLPREEYYRRTSGGGA